MKNNTFERPHMVPPGSSQPTCERERVPGDPTVTPRTPRRSAQAAGSNYYTVSGKKYAPNWALLIRDLQQDIELLRGRGGREPFFVIEVDNEQTARELDEKLGDLHQWAVVNVKQATG